MRKAAIKFAAFLFYGVTLLAAMRPNQLVFKTVVRPPKPNKKPLSGGGRQSRVKLGLSVYFSKLLGEIT